MFGQEPHVRPRLAALVLIALTAVAVPAALGAGGSPTVGQLRQRDRSLAAHERSAVLGLYALQTRLARADAALASYRTQAASLRSERVLVATQLRLARRGVALSQRRLAQRVRALYERSGPDPVAIVLGAESLDAAMTAIDSLGQVASGDRRVLDQVRGARTTLVVLQRRLAIRQAKLDQVVAAAAATTRQLAGAESARRSYVASLATQRRLARSQIARVEAQAAAAQQRALALEAAPAAPVAASPPAAPDTISTPAATPAPASAAGPASRAVDAAAPAAPVAAPADTGRTLTVTATGYALPGRTATGLPVGWGVAAVDPSVIPLGTRFTVPGYGEAVAADIGSGVRGATIDLWFPTTAQAQSWGRRVVTVALH